MGIFNLNRSGKHDTQRLDRLFQNMDLSLEIPAQPGLVGKLGQFTAKLQQRITLSLHAAVGIAAHAPQLASIARTTEKHGEQLAQSSELIASAVEEISASLEAELVPGATAVADLSRDVTVQLKDCTGDSQLVLKQVETIQNTEEQLASEIIQLGKQIEEVNQVISMIATISQQTNLLALNAAIEAARAGELGRGFAVVADEVRRLAGNTTEATNQVSQIIDGFRSSMQRLNDAGASMHLAVADGREGIQRVDKGLIQATGAMEQLDQRVAGMASGTEQIGAAVRSVSRDVQNVADVASELQRGATEVREHSDAVRNESDRLLEGLGDFQLGIHQQILESVTALAAEPSMGASIREAERAMQQCIARDNRLELLYLVGADGIQVSENVLAADLLPAKDSVRGKNWSTRPWFRAAKEKLVAHISPVYRSSATDAFCFTLSTPVFDKEGRLRYVLGADVRLSALLSDNSTGGLQPQPSIAI
ncbi:methyl-accepting chemotaxis protein [uncultured Halopseudomonas sp.]|uniref:methyl-accepting chemotaxis protein n=1 Tax=uncultured Halopseudomonas sp. TaxID=2901193 RepID=UPI0030EBB646|tara:strand:- start:2081 stop:3517 length:1437 start_codon:yes stop_codon:yes gene_type:complete